MSDKPANVDHQQTEGGRPDTIQDDPKKMRQKPKDHWNDATDTMDEAPAASPNAEEQSRKS